MSAPHEHQIQSFTDNCVICGYNPNLPNDQQGADAYIGPWPVPSETPAMTPAHDIINKAPHYNQGKYEVIEVLKDWGLEKDALLWNTVKYIARAWFKGNLLQDLQKARYYLDRRIKELEASPNGNR
jgi:hypothetical protein